MPQQAPLRLIKRWRRYWPRIKWRDVPRYLRGFYVLYKVEPRTRRAQVSYIGISGLGTVGKGIRSRLKQHNRKKPGWSIFLFSRCTTTSRPRRSASWKRCYCRSSAMTHEFD